MDEEWLPIKGYEGSYEVSSFGRVRSIDRYEANKLGSVIFYAGRILAAAKADKLGHRNVTLSCAAHHTTRYVHQLVLEAFVSPQPAGALTRHLDGDPTNNAVSNLRWGTAQENSDDRRKHGTMNYSLRRGYCRQGHVLDDDNTYRYANGVAKCRRCRADQQLAYRARNPHAKYQNECSECGLLLNSSVRRHMERNHA